MACGIYNIMSCLSVDLFEDVARHCSPYVNLLMENVATLDMARICEDDSWKRMFEGPLKRTMQCVYRSNVSLPPKYNPLLSELSYPALRNVVCAP